MKVDKDLVKVCDIFEKKQLHVEKKSFHLTEFSMGVIAVALFSPFFLFAHLSDKKAEKSNDLAVLSVLEGVDVEKKYSPSGELLNVSWNAKSTDGVFDYSYKRDSNDVIYKNIKANLGDLTVSFKTFNTIGSNMFISSKNCESVCEYYVERRDKNGQIKNEGVEYIYFRHFAEVKDPSFFNNSYLVEKENDEIKNKYPLKNVFRVHELENYKESLGNEKMVSAFNELNEVIKKNKK